MKFVRRIAGWWVVVFIAVSCLDDPECLGLNNNVIGVTFKTLPGGAAATMENMTVTAEGAAGPLYLAVNASLLLLPLNNYEQATRYNISIGDSLFYLQLAYQTRVKFVSEECGSRFELSGLQVTAHNFDSVRLVSATPGSTTSARNIEIFWR